MEGPTSLIPPVTGAIQVWHAHLPHFLSWQCVTMLLFLFVWPSDPVFAVSPAVSDVSSPEQYLVQGWRRFQQGAFDQAITSWAEAARLYGRAGKPNKQSETLTYLAQAYQSIGQYRQALQNLKSALVLVKKSDDRTQMVSVLGSLGNIYIAIGPAETAQEYLSAGLGMAREMGDSALAAGILNNLGNLFTFQQQYTEALRAYTESKDPRYQHPGYWSPFLLINNWL